MTVEEQVPRRVAMAKARGRRPLRWIAAPAVAEALQVGDGAYLEGLPVDIGKPKSNWGLDLVCEPRA